MRARSGGCLLLVELVCAVIGLAVSMDSAIAADGDAEAGARLSIFCAYCHGSDGNPYYPGAPRLAGQEAETLVSKMKAKRKAYQNDHRNLMMATFVTAGCFNDRDIENLASYFSKQIVRSTPGTTSERKEK